MSQLKKAALATALDELLNKQAYNQQNDEAKYDFTNYHPHNNTPLYNHFYSTYTIEEAKVKSASILAAIGAHVGIGGAIHVAQNQLAKVALGLKSSKNLYRHMFHAGMKGINPANAKSVHRGVVGTIVPEVNVMGGMAKNFGHHFETALKGTSHRGYSNLKGEHKEYLKRFAGGDFDHVVSKLDKPEYRELAGAYLHGTKAMIPSEKYHKHIDSIVDLIKKDTHPGRTNMIISQLKKSPTAANVGQAYKGSYISKILPAVFDDLHIKEVHSLANAARTGKRYTHAVPELALNAGMLAIDPVVPGFNALKRTMTSETIKKVPGLRRVQKWLGNKLINQPFQKSWEAGMAGKYHPHTGIKKIIHRDVWNPLEHDMNETVGRVATAIGKSPEIQLSRSTNVLHAAHKSNDPIRIAAAQKYQVPKVQAALKGMGRSDFEVQKATELAENLPKHTKY